MHRISFSLALAAALFATGSALQAAELPPPSGVVSLASSATVEVAKDLMSVTLTATREGADANAVQTALKQALDAALAEARRVAKPGQLDVQTGNFSLMPRYTKQGQISGWQGAAELQIDGRDMPAIAQLAGRINTMTVARVGTTLSRELRERAEGEVTGQAIARYRAKAADVAKQFGYAGYTVREVNVAANEPGVIVPMRAQLMQAGRDEAAPLPVEAGKAVVTVTVSGTVQLTR